MHEPPIRRPSGDRLSSPARPGSAGVDHAGLDHAGLFAGFAERLAGLIAGASARPGSGRRARRPA